LLVAAEFLAAAAIERDNEAFTCAVAVPFIVSLPW